MPVPEMLTPEEERQIRDKVRRSLESLGRGRSGDGSESDNSDLDKLTAAERIIADETERYYQSMGLVKYTSRSGRVLWVTPQDAERFKRRREEPHRKGRRKINGRVLLVWGIAILLSLLVAAYLIETQVVGVIDEPGMSESPIPPDPGL